jgi:transcriptional regulator with XRE-family HTH domain
MERRNRIGVYLRARRALLHPEATGLTAIGRRRVPGLRREELALLAGISADYYLRLEQGREQHPSDEVLAALARALQLDDESTAYLHQLAHPAARRRSSRRTERVEPGISQLVASWTLTPAIVYGRTMDVLVVNAIATALSPMFTPGVNIVRAVFLDPAVRALYGESWERSAAGTLATLRGLAGPDVDDPRLSEVVGELSVRSEDFRRLWARHDVRARKSGTRVFMHPQVGPLELHFEKLALADSDGQVLVVYHAQNGTAAAGALARLVPAPASKQRRAAAS